MANRQKDSGTITLTVDEVTGMIDDGELPEALIDAFAMASSMADEEFDRVISIIVTVNPS